MITWSKEIKEEFHKLKKSDIFYIYFRLMDLGLSIILQLFYVTREMIDIIKDKFGLD